MGNEAFDLDAFLATDLSGPAQGAAAQNQGGGFDVDGFLSQDFSEQPAAAVPEQTAPAFDVDNFLAQDFAQQPEPFQPSAFNAYNQKAFSPSRARTAAPPVSSPEQVDPTGGEAPLPTGARFTAAETGRNIGEDIAAAPAAIGRGLARGVRGIAGSASEIASRRLETDSLTSLGGATDLIPSALKQGILPSIAALENVEKAVSAIPIIRRGKQKLVKSLRAWKKRWDAGSPQEQEEWSKAPLAKALEVVGEGAPLFGAAIAAAIATKSPVIPSLLFGEVGGASTFESARGAGNTVLLSDITARANQAWEVVSEGIAFDKILGNAGKSALKRMAGGAAVEGTQELLQTVGTNLIEKVGFDRARNIFEGWLEALVGGVGLGTVGGGAVRSDIDTDGAAPPVMPVPSDIDGLGRSELRAQADELGVSNKGSSKAIGERIKDESQNRAQEYVTKSVDDTVPPPIPAASAVADPGTRPDPKSPDVDTEKLLDGWFAEKDDKVQSARSEGARIQDQIQNIAGEKKFGKLSKDIDRAIQLNIDLREIADTEIPKYWDKLSTEQKKLVELSQSLTPEQLAIADAVIESNAATGINAQDAGVIRSVRDNYSARLWERDTKAGEASPKFGTTTARAKQRTLTSILEGWAKGKKLSVEGASNALSVMQEQIHSTIQDRALLQAGKDVGVFSDKQQEGFVRLEHPGFTTWKWAGKGATEADVSSKNIFVTPEGQVFERVPVYAEAKLGNRLNRTLRRSKLEDIKGVKALTRLNSELKQTILTSSFFHHQAFLRSYLFGGRVGAKDLNPAKAYREGLGAIKEYTPEIRELTRGGLTIGRVQDWDGSNWQREKTRIGALIDKQPVAGAIKKKLLKLRDGQTDFLFNKLGPGLKAQAAMLEYRHLLKKHDAKLRSGEMTREDIAKMTANIINDDFGGLHLQRMGRSAEGQHVFRMLALAPDWTESNVRSMAKAFQRGAEGQVYRDFWGRIAWKGMVSTTLFNLLMASFDDELEGDNTLERFKDQQKKAWKAGNLKWMGVDITPIAKRLGVDNEGRRKYFSLIGHFRDPIKFLSHPIRSAQHKSSVLGRMFMEAMTGQDWAGRNFTSFSELLGTDDKGVYKTTRSGKYRKGQDKGGQLKGRMVRKRRGPAKALEVSQIPSYIGHTARSSLPIQMQNAISFGTGELDAFDAVAKSLGLLVQTDYRAPDQPKKIRQTRRRRRRRRTR